MYRELYAYIHKCLHETTSNLNSVRAVQQARCGGNAVNHNIIVCITKAEGMDYVLRGRGEGCNT